jgi:hypothetical protein
VADDHQPVLGPLAKPVVDRCRIRAGLEDLGGFEEVLGIQLLGDDLGGFPGSRQRAGDDAVQPQVQRMPRAISCIRF